MDNIMKEKAINRFEIAWSETSKLYNDTALLLNSCDIAKKRYENMKDEMILDTVKNMPEELKLQVETGFCTTFTNWYRIRTIVLYKFNKM